MKESSDYRWPIGLAGVLGIVVVVNLVMAWWAVNNPPEIVPSYDLIER